MGRTLGPVLIGYTGQSLWSDTIMNLYGGRDRHRGAMVVYGGAHWGQSLRSGTWTSLYDQKLLSVSMVRHFDQSLWSVILMHL